MSVLAYAAVFNLAAMAHAFAQQSAAAPTTPSSTPQATTTPAPKAAPKAAPKTDALSEVVVHGIRRGEFILPTTLNSTSAYGLDLNVMETPRNNTVLTHAQLDALNIQDPQEFSYLTSSSYTDAAFGVPDVPRIRGQYADVFFNGMRDSFTSNGYGAPLSFNSIDTLDIVKGPASVQAGPGQGVGGAVNISTKTPNPNVFTGSASTEFDTQDHRRWTLDIGGPIGDQNLTYRISYAGEESDSYYNDQYFDEQAVYGIVRARFSPQYSVQVNSEVALQNYTEDDGVNRVNQQLINNGLYLTGGVVGPLESFGSTVLLGAAVPLSDRVNIDEAPGTGAQALRYNLQIIQTYDIASGVSLVNNTFFNYLNRYNQVEYYFADSCKDCFTIENKTDLKLKFDTPISSESAINNSIDAGVTFRYAHVNEVQDFDGEPVSIYDLTGNPASWVFPAALQVSQVGAYSYTAPFGHQQFGLPARYSGAYDASIISNLSDIGAFMEHRLQWGPQLSLLYGLRGDLVQLNEADPLGGASYGGLPQTESTAWYGLANGNISPVYQFAPWGSAYLTYNYAQYVDPNSNDGGVGTFGLSPAHVLQQETRLYEGGLKFNLLDKSLFISTAVFKQSRAVPTGPGDTQSSFAHITGFEFELNYQPNRNFFATTSYSFIQTKLDTAASFYNYPAEPGVNIDGAGALAVFLPNQTFNDPGVPEQVFNLLTNYKTNFGLGFQGTVQVTGPIETSTSGYLDLVNSSDVPANIVANGGYYKSPVIPWQYTMNIAAFYDYKNYEVKLAAYNLTNQHNLVNDYPFYGNDFITRSPPFSLDLTLKVKFH
jgi:hypothetical protein